MAKIVQSGANLAGKPSPVGQYAARYDQHNIDFDRDAFTQMLSNKGYSVSWEKAVFCPNRPKDAQSPLDHDITCSLCDGFGLLYFGAINTKMLMTGMTLNQSFAAFGRWDPGQAMVTALPEQRLNYWDRLTLLNGITRFHELVTRQPDKMVDRLKYAPLSVDIVVWQNRSGELQTFTVNTHFTISAAGITWLGAARPDAGSTYSVAYTYRPRYVVLDLVHQHRDSTVQGAHYEFPTQAVAKLDFLIRDESKDDAQVQYQNPFPR